MTEEELLARWSKVAWQALAEKWAKDPSGVVEARQELASAQRQLAAAEARVQHLEGLVKLLAPCDGKS